MTHYTSKDFSKIKRAEELEKEADKMREESLGKIVPRIVKKGEELKQREEPPTPEAVARKYERASDFYVEGGDYIKAKEVLRRAKIYGYSYNQEDSDRIDERIRQVEREQALASNFPRSRLEKRFARNAYAAASLICFVFAMMFVSINLSGYSVLEVNSDNSNWIGLCLFICGLVFVFLYANSKKRF